MSDADDEPKRWNVLHPSHPDNRASALARASRCYADLLQCYGSREAKDIWDHVAAKFHRGRGRPRGSRSRAKTQNDHDAIRVLHAVAFDPANFSLSSWQVFRRTAEILYVMRNADSAAGAAIRGVSVGEAPAHNFRPPSFDDWIATRPNLTAKQKAARRAFVETVHRQLERLQAEIDADRALQLSYLNQLEAQNTSDDLELVRPYLSKQRDQIRQAFPELPQSSNPRQRPRRTPSSTKHVGQK